MKPQTQMKIEFLRSVLRAGGPARGEGVLGGWVKEFEAPLEPKGYGRFINRFELGTTVNVKTGVIIPGAGFVRMSPSKRTTEIQTLRSRRVLDVVAGVFEGLCWLEARTGAAPVTDVGSCEMQMSRMKGSRSELFRALEVVRDWLIQAKVVQEGKNTAVFSGAGGRGGFRFRCGVGWIHSPRAAFVALTAFKLAVMEPSLVWAGDGKVQLERLLAWYKGRDDDARLAHWMMRKFGVRVVDKNVYESWRVKQDVAVAGAERVGWQQPPTKESVAFVEKMLKGIQAVPMSVAAKALKVPEPRKDGWWLVNCPGISRRCGDLLVPFEVWKDVLRGGEKVVLPKGMKAKVKVVEKILGVEAYAGLDPRVMLVDRDWLDVTPQAPGKVRRALLELGAVRRGEETPHKKPQERFQGKVLFEV